MKISIVALLMAVLLLAVACGSEQLPANEPGPVDSTSPATPSPTASPDLASLYARTPVTRATPINSDFVVEAYDLLDIRRVPDTLFNAASSSGDEIVDAWIEYLSNTELLSQLIVPLVVTCGDGAGQLTGTIPDDPEYAKYFGLPFTWEITRTAADSRASVKLTLRFDPPVDEFLWAALDRGNNVGATNVEQRTEWTSSLDIEDEKILHRIGHRSNKDVNLSNVPGRGIAGSLADAIETDKCDGKGRADDTDTPPVATIPPTEDPFRFEPAQDELSASQWGLHGFGEYRPIPDAFLTGTQMSEEEATALWTEYFSDGRIVTSDHQIIFNHVADLCADGSYSQNPEYPYRIDQVFRDPSSRIDWIVKLRDGRILDPVIELSQGFTKARFDGDVNDWFPSEQLGWVAVTEKTNC